MENATVLAHRAAFAATKTRLQSRLGQMGPKSRVHVAIDAGLQAGISRSLKTSTLTIGSSAASGLRILDAGVADAHAQISFTRTLFGSMAEVACLDASCEINGDRLDAGQTLRGLALPLTVQIGPARIVVSSPKRAAPGRSRAATIPAFLRRWKVDPVLGTSVLALALLLLGAGVWQVLDGHRSYVIERNARALLPQAPEPVAGSWEEAVRGQITAQGLIDIVEVNQSATDLLQVTGQVPELHLEAYRALQTWYDSQRGAPALIWDVALRPALVDIPKVAMVRLSDPPRLTLANGQALAEGDALAQGWRIKAIEDSGLTLEQGSETVVLPWNKATAR